LTLLSRIWTAWWYTFRQEELPARVGKPNCLQPEAVLGQNNLPPAGAGRPI